MPSFDMGEAGLDSHETVKSRGQPSTSTPSDTASGAGSSSSVDQVLSVLLNSNLYPLAQNPLDHPIELPSFEQAFNQFAQEYYQLHNTLNTSISPYTNLVPVVHREGNSGNPATQFPPPVASSSFTPYASPRFSEVADADIGEAKMAPNPEEKRRRNTAASVKFRIKKKQRTVDLERSVSDLKGRAEKLEREATDLRRENNWLKEILMLKGARHVAVQRQLAPRQLVQSVGIHLPLGVGGQGSASSGAVSPSFSKETTFPEEISSKDSEPKKIG